MKKLINKVENIVDEMVEGVVASAPNKLAKVDGYNVVYSKTFNKNNVALVSGGGSGHEPAHAGYIGDGMLTAAVAGAIFTSPTPDMVQAAINACDSQKGTLLIIKNYTGDVMNFQMAAEMASAENKKTDFVVVADDVSLINNKADTGMRGIAGTVLVHKVTGAKAQTGASLEEVKAVAEKAIKNVGTYGLALDACVVPAIGHKGFTLGDNEVEMGLGIHGEPGVKKTQMQPVDNFVQEMMDAIISHLQIKANDKVAVLVNGLGATPLMELYIANRKAQQILKSKSIQMVSTFVGNYMTAIDMPGMSISLMKLDSELEQLIKAKADTLALKV
ncbi:MAG: dihydroxyacetone kinase subunit DhaK [Mycoplasmataceae bacterium]|jgi:dihydroxyacetone kinase-like protein|nr:dihydroxyacetone kinase subunit DhaK [Mycoplasmataceae bacterium]